MLRKSRKTRLYSEKTAKAIDKFKIYQTGQGGLPNFQNNYSLKEILNSFKRRLTALIAVLIIAFMVLIFTISNNNKPLSKLSVSGYSQELISFDSFKSTVEIIYDLPENQTSEKVLEEKMRDIRNSFAALGFDKSNSELISSSDILSSSGQRQQVLTLKFSFQEADTSLNLANDFLKSLENHGKVSYYPIEYPENIIQESCEKVQIQAIKKAKEKGENMVKEIGGKQVLSIESNSFSPCPKNDTENQSESDFTELSSQTPIIILNKTVSSEAFIALQFV